MLNRKFTRLPVYWRRLGSFFVGTLVTVLLAFPVVTGFLLTFPLTQLPCDAGGLPSDWNPPLQSVTFPTNGYTLDAYFIPAQPLSPGTVILIPTLNQGRAAQMDYVRLFHQQGLNVFTFEARRCAGGRITFGYHEGADAAAAYRYLLTRDDIDPARVSVHGFSAGGAAALFAMAQEPALVAASVAGNYDHFDRLVRETRLGNPYFDVAFHRGARWGYRLGAGESLDVLVPGDRIEPHINPRPILFIYGDVEPGWGSGQRMFAAAANGEFWQVPGAGHGDYLRLYPEETQARLGAFHRKHLLAEIEQGHS